MEHRTLTHYFDLDDTETTITNLLDACAATVCAYLSPIYSAMQRGEFMLSEEEKETLMELCADVHKNLTFIENNIGYMRAGILGEEYEEKEG